MTAADPVEHGRVDEPDDADSLVKATPTLVATDVHITYRTYSDRRQGLGQRLRQGYRASTREFREVKAVRGVSLTLHHGESLGIIGSNGSGKSTLLTGLAGLVPLQQGEVLATARPSLLGVGSVLNRRLSGRRNIMLGCLALGMPRAQVPEITDRLIEFTSLGEAIDRPLRTYSSGMRARLAFAIATVVEPEILMIDEALAVGDRSFRGRAAERLEEIRANAGSVIVVSHSLSEISAMCTRVAWMDEGRIRLEGKPKTVLSAYRDANPDHIKAKKRKRHKAQ